MGDLVNEFNKLLAEGPHARGDATLFNKRLVFLTCMNDAKKWQRDARARTAAAILSRVPEGLLVIAGPADAATWHITDASWDEKAQHYMDILKACGHAVLNCKAPLAAMTLASGVSKKRGRMV